MFYIVVALWLVACLVSYMLRKIQRAYLRASGPYIALGGAASAVLLFALGETTAAAILLIATVYVCLILVYTLTKQQSGVVTR
jgi:hypothetical protein